MKLQLKYNPASTGNISAAFFRGSDAVVWMKAISRLDIDPDTLECYVISDPSTNSAAGLFVIFSKADQSKLSELTEPYCSVTPKLFIPLNSELYPALSNEELKDLLIWPKQIFHPAFGFSGVEETDRLPLSSLFHFSHPELKDWSFAHPGSQSLPGLQSIRVPQPEVEDLVKELKRSLGEKDLKDITGNENDPSLLKKWGMNIVYYMLKGLFQFSIFLNKIFQSLARNTPGSASGGQPYSNPRDTGTGFFSWLEKKLDTFMIDLESKRAKEINRLLKMFDKNTDEALQYAIPINSQYQNRGISKSSASLFRRLANFNLNNLGGGQVTSYWDLGNNHLNNLRTKYNRAAEEAIKNKDYRKAAYVYAHLLGEYFHAARVLEDGGFHREAAAIHIRHLKNKPEAANCYARGGLYLEAIELYTELGADEVAGELHLKLKQHEKAKSAFRRTVNKKLAANDHIDASRVLDEKLSETAEAKKVLLDGWGSIYNSEKCLQNYYDLTIKHDPDQLIPEIKNIYQQKVATDHEISFLNVLEYVHKKNPDEQVQQTMHDIAFEIVHSRIEKKDRLVVKKLSNFFPDDKLLKADISRYVNNSIETSRKKEKPALHLGQDVIWKSVTRKFHYFLAVGIMKNALCLVRGNWDGHTEYHTLRDNIAAYMDVELITDPYSSSPVFLSNSSENTSVPYRINMIHKELPNNKYFHPATVLVGLDQSGSVHGLWDDEPASIGIENGWVVLHTYDPIGAALEKITLITPFEQFANIAVTNGLAGRNNQVYFCIDEQLYIGNRHGDCKVQDQFPNVTNFVLSDQHPSGILMLAKTRAGFLLGKIEGKSVSLISSTFAEEFFHYKMTFIGNKHFALFGDDNVRLYHIDEQNAKKVIFVKSKPIAVFHTSTHNEFAIFQENGAVSFAQLD